MALLVREGITLEVASISTVVIRLLTLGYGAFLGSIATVIFGYTESRAHRKDGALARVE